MDAKGNRHGSITLFIASLKWAAYHPGVRPSTKVPEPQ
jgi:hypothetical protein